MPPDSHASRAADQSFETKKPSFRGFNGCLVRFFS